MSQSTNDRIGVPTWITALIDGEQYKIPRAERRLLTLTVVREQQSPIELGSLAAEVARREHGPDVDDESVDRIATSLHHLHLPALDEYGAVDYATDTHLVRP